jgi:hypothetical protein
LQSPTNGFRAFALARGVPVAADGELPSRARDWLAAIAMLQS